MIDLDGAWKRLNHVMGFMVASVFVTFTGTMVISTLADSNDGEAMMTWLKTLAMFGPLGIVSALAYILRIRIKRRG